VIGRLVGLVVDQGDDGVVTLDVGGVGYEVTVPLGAIGRARHDELGRATLHVHTVVREDAFLLYGFASLEERAAFRTLLTISNVGPKIGVAILSALSPEELSQVVSRRELSRLVAIGGVGKKTAERLLLELKDKLHVGRGPALAHAPSAPSAPAGNAKLELLRGALANMGWKPHEVERAVEAVHAHAPNAELADLVREALAVLST
jgi:Holliday junction DNA helicase RuvA